MRFILRVAVVFLCVAGCALVGDRPPSIRIPATPEVWDGDPDFWSFEDGVIIGESTPEKPLARTTYLLWQGGDVENFELDFEVRINGGNSGVQFRSREVGPWDVHGYQADLDAANQWSGCLYEQGGRGVLGTRGLDIHVATDDSRQESWLPGAEGGIELPANDPATWRNYRIRAIGNVVTLEVDGILTLRFADESPGRSAAGRLALQLHQGPPMRVEYRNFVLRELSAGEPESTLATTASPVSHWIWTARVEDDQHVWLHHTFELEEVTERAELWATCDNGMELFINGESVATSEQWERPIRVDVTDELIAGHNRIAVQAKNQAGPAGFICTLDVEQGDSTLRIVSDSSWSVTAEAPDPDRDWKRNDVREWPTATDLGPRGTSPWGQLGPGEAPRSNEALAASEITVAEGFEVELLYSVPRLEQGSWVSLCAGEGDTLFASDQYGSLYRIHLGEKPSVEELPVDLGRAHGLLWAFDSLYVVVSEGGDHESGLYRVRDTNADGALDTSIKLAEFEGSGEHGPHAVVLGPDGRSLYVIAGNHVDLPELASSRVPEVWGEDLLLPRLDDPNGHAVGKRAPGGWIVATDPNGSAFELVAMGFRNPYDMAFDENGELFTFDADMEWDTGLPWYRPTRILHVASGAEFGWRTGSGKWPAFYPDSLPGAVDVGLSSPTGVAMGTGAAFPARWRRALFAADWAYGTIYAIHLQAKGASFVGQAEPFLSGKPLPVTDLAVADDGALYFTTGGRHAQSGLYRVRWSDSRGQADVALPAPTPEAVLRRKLEGLHGVGSAEAIETAWPHLGHEDRHVRFAARTAIESADPLLWRERAKREADPSHAIAALLALTRCDPNLTAAEFVTSSRDWEWERFAPDQLLRALRVLGLGILRVDGVEAGTASLQARLLAMLPTGNEACDMELVRLLAACDVGALIPIGLDLLRTASTQEGAIHYAYALSSVRAGWDEATRARYFAWFDLTASDYEGGVSFRQFLDEIRRRAADAMGISLAAESIDSSNAEFAPDEPPLPFVRDYVADDLTPILDRLDRGRDFQRGKALFRRTSCLQCHRIAGEGGATGPDLTGVASRYSPRDLLDSLLDPSAVVSDQYRETEVWSIDGSLAVGRIVSDEDGLVVVRESSGDFVEIPVEDIELRREHPLSRMPEGLLDTLEEEDVLDLMAFVLAGGNEEDPAFGP